MQRKEGSTKKRVLRTQDVNTMLSGLLEDDSVKWDTLRRALLPHHKLVSDLIGAMNNQQRHHKNWSYQMSRLGLGYINECAVEPEEETAIAAMRLLACASSSRSVDEGQQDLPGPPHTQIHTYPH